MLYDNQHYDIRYNIDDSKDYRLEIQAQRNTQHYCHEQSRVNDLAPEHVDVGYPERPCKKKT